MTVITYEIHPGANEPTQLNEANRGENSECACSNSLTCSDRSGGLPKSLGSLHASADFAGRDNSHSVLTQKIPGERHNQLPYDIHIAWYGDGPTDLCSGLRLQSVDQSVEAGREGEAAVHAIESLLLALAHRGVDMGTPEVSLALVDVVEAMNNYLS